MLQQRRQFLAYLASTATLWPFRGLTIGAEAMTDVDNLDDLANAISNSSPKIRAYAIAQAAATQSQELDLRNALARIAALESVPEPEPEPEPEPPPTGDKLLYRPPGWNGSDPRLASSFPGFQVMSVRNSQTAFLDALGKDVFVKIEEPLTNRPIQVRNARHVALVGGSSKAVGDLSTALRFESCTGVLHVEGWDVFTESGIGLMDAIAINRTPVAGHHQELQVQMSRLGPCLNRGSSGHADGIQCQPGVQLYEARLDRVTIDSNLQGTFWKDSETSTDFVKRVIQSRVNYRHCFHSLWQERTSTPITLLEDNWVGDTHPQRVFGLDVWPQTDGYGMGTSGRKAVLAADGLSLTFVNTNITGKMWKGNPPGGDFAPKAKVGMGYVPPGYV